MAEPVREIAADPESAYRYTAKGNLVAVITNGTAILGLGNLGPLASKPVMESKALLFKRFASIDAIDIEVQHTVITSYSIHYTKLYESSRSSEKQRYC